MKARALQMCAIRKFAVVIRTVLVKEPVEALR